MTFDEWWEEAGRFLWADAPVDLARAAYAAGREVPCIHDLVKKYSESCSRSCDHEST